MNLPGIALLMLLLAAPLCAAASVPPDHRDARDDVVRFEGEEDEEPADLAGVDLTAITAEIDGADLLVTAHFAADVPRDLDVSIVYRIGEEVHHLAAFTFMRSDSPGDEPYASAFFDNASTGENGFERMYVTMGRQAIQFVVPGDSIDPLPCFAFQRAVASSIVEDGAGAVWTYMDQAEATPTCETESTPPPEPTPAPAAAPSEDVEERAGPQARTPVGVIVVLGAFAIAALARRS